VADRAVIVHGTARQDIHKTAADSGKEYPDPGKAVRLLQVIDRYLDCGDFRNGFAIFKNTGNFRLSIIRQSHENLIISDGKPYLMGYNPFDISIGIR